ncbi:MAG: chromosomal replication initiator protein DnaA [Clostridia bacterium]|nr:chromosomal replication initiator protein DnaA [Clostridia bacterium]
MEVSDELKELNEIWKEVKKSFTDELTVSTINLWFEPLELTAFENNTIHFSCPSAVKTKIIKESHLDRMKKGFAAFLGFDVDVNVFYSTSSDDGKIKILSVNSKIISKEDILPERPINREVEVGSASFPYHFEYTFENFIVGESNKFAHSVCLGVADNPACLESERLYNGVELARSPYNPLFIYGPSGLGKTHLLHAIINRRKSNIPDVKILYVKCEDFTNQLIDHLSRKAMAEFKEKYRRCDVLLIDDIQFLAGKTSTQEEFFHTFDALYNDNKQIILTSDRPPKEIQPLEERIVTRFEWGLLADIQPPDFELRVAILKKKAEQVKITLSDEILEYLAENLRSNVRQIEGAIKKLAAQRFMGIEITFDLAKKCISELMGGEKTVSETIDKIFEAVKKNYGVSKEDILSENRKKEIANARHIVTYLIYSLTDISYPKLAKIMNKKNHSACVSSCQIMEERIREDASFSAEINSLRKEIEKMG